MNPTMKIITEVTTNVMSTEDDTAAASEHSAVVLDSGTFSIYYMKKTITMYFQALYRVLYNIID